MEIASLLIFLIFLRFIIRNTRTYKIILSIIFMLVAIPAGIFTELGVNGCCGAPKTGHEGIGIIVAVALFLIGLLLLIITLKQKRS